MLRSVRSTAIGLLVLALLLGGYYWTRVAHAPVTAPSASHMEGAPASSDARRLATAVSDAMLPDVTVGAATVSAGDVRITLDVTPHPPIAFTANRFRVRAESPNGAVPLEDARISFEMAMPMGDHRYTLVPGSGGLQDAEVVLPMCGSGNPRWYATVEGTVRGERRSVRFKFDLATTAAPSAP
jgi:hypothetical protein